MSTQTLDRHELERLEGREIELSRLATLFVIILGVALAMFMYMYIFLVFRGQYWELNVAFVGFCLLTVFFATHLQLHQRSVRKLKQKLMAELDLNARLRDEPTVELLHEMLGFPDFAERLEKEFVRAVAAETGLSVMLVEVGGSPCSNDTLIVDGVKALARGLRPMDSVYRLSMNMFGVVLTGANSTSAGRVSARLHGALQWVRTKYDANVTVATFSYPDEVSTVQQLEEVVKVHIGRGLARKEKDAVEELVAAD